MGLNAPPTDGLDALLPTPRTCCSDLQLDRLALGLLPDDDAVRLRAHLATSPSCAARAAAFAAEPTSTTSTTSTTAATSTTATTKRSWRGAFAAAGGIAAAVVLFTVQRGDQVQTKGTGDLALTVFVQRGAAVDAVKDGDTVVAGEVVRFVVQAPAPGVVIVVSRDGAGTESTYVPATAVVPGRVELPGAIELDDVVGVEHISALFCEAAAAARAVPAAAFAATAPAGCRAAHTTFVKRS